MKAPAHLLEILVEEAVHDGVGAGGAHGSEVHYRVPHQHPLLLPFIRLKATKVMFIIR